MNMKMLSISSLLFLVTGFTQCEVENLQQKENYAAFLKIEELKEQFNNSQEGRDFNQALLELNMTNMNLETMKQNCNRLDNCETSSELIEAFFAANKAKSNFMQQTKKIKHLEVCKLAAELEQKYQ